ncbi:methyltransferase [Paenibacillus sp. GCM10012303]|uniref:methyltransferase n=1 Tax=Paenibacillus sp. GCM10012303 TaxID=3317340 RepID=UPI00360DB332
MNINKSLVRRHFDRHASEYERYADVQKEMAEDLIAHAMERLGARGAERVERILEIGCGTGRLTAMLVSAFPNATIAAVDLSPNMVEAARHNLRRTRPDRADRVCWIEGDAEKLLADGSELRCSVEAAGWDSVSGDDRRPDDPMPLPPFDLIISNAAFQWFNKPAETVAACIDLLGADGGVLAFSTFGPGTFHQLHASFAEAERQLDAAPSPHGQRFLGQDEWRACAEGEAGEFRWSGAVRTFVYADVRTFLHQVKRVGAGNAVTGSRSGVGGRKLLETMERIYTESFPAGGGGIEADYEIGYGTFVRGEK